MRRSKTLEKIRRGDVVRICALGHYVPSFVRHAAAFGFDCVWLDLEHRTISTIETQALLAFAHGFDIDCMVRSPTREKPRLYRFLEDGAAGLLIPHVSTAEEARRLVDAVKFPPIGNRGLDGAGLDADFYHDEPAGYPEAANEQTFLIVQIESPEAVQNVEAIAAVEGLDGMFIGPGDLQMRIDRCGADFTLADAERRVASAAAEYGKAWGRPASSGEEIRRLRDLGAQLLAHGGDFMAIRDMLKATAADFDEALGGSA